MLLERCEIDCCVVKRLTNKKVAKCANLEVFNPAPDLGIDHSHDGGDSVGCANHLVGDNLEELVVGQIILVVKSAIEESLSMK